MTPSKWIRAALACIVLVIASSPSQSALKKYDLTIRAIVNSGTGALPNPNISNPGINGQEFSVALIDSAAGPSPALRKFVRATDATITTITPALIVGIFTSVNFREGPGVLEQIHGSAVPAFTGTGNISGGSAIRWGIVSGWTNSGTFWCNSSPAVVCTLAMGMDQDTADPRFNSAFYDLGTWSFHGTGFSASPNVVLSYFSSNFGNQQLWVRGGESQDGTVPVLPLAGTLILGGSLIAGAAVALRRRRN